MASVAALTDSVQVAVCLTRDVCVCQEGSAMHTVDITLVLNAQAFIFPNALTTIAWALLLHPVLCIFANWATE